MPAKLRRRLTQRIARRALLRATARAGVGAAAIAALGAGQTSIRPLTAAAQAGVQRGATLEFPYVGQYSANPPTLDPYENLTYRTQIASGFHYSKLIRPVSAGPGISPLDQAQQQPDLANSLPEMVDETTLVFKLRSDVRWHDLPPVDGRRLTVDDVLYSHDRFLQQSPHAGQWSNRIRSLASGRQNTVTVRTSEAYAPVLPLIGSSSYLWIVPREIVEDGTVAERPVGSGAWIFDSFQADAALHWRRNPTWHSAGPLGEPLADRVVATMNGDMDVLIPALGQGSLDFMRLSAEYFKQAQEAAPQIEEDDYVFTPNTVPGGFFFNFSIPPWNDVRVRQALSLSLDRDHILTATDDTGRGGWQSAIAQLPPYWLDPKDLEAFGETFEGEPSGKLFHVDFAESRRLLDAAGYPDGISATLHATADYGRSVVNFYEVCARSASEGGFQFEFFFKQYAAYITSILRGNFPDDWDGESSHLAIGPFFRGALHVGALDPDELLSAIYSRESGRHNWGAAGRLAHNSVNMIDRGGNASAWFHPSAARGGGPESDERLDEMIERQRQILDPAERRNYINDMQRYLATKMYIVPYTATPGVYAFQPYMRYREHAAMPMKATYGWGQEFIPGLWKGMAQPDIEMSSTRPDEYSEWQSMNVATASWILPRLPGVRAIWKWTGNQWIAYGLDSSGQQVPGAQDFEVRHGDMLYLSG